jgi:Domain of unknown function (DUF6504)
VADLISESIRPAGGFVEGAATARREPALPAGFSWRGDTYQVVATAGAWKESDREGGRATGELYLRRHYYRLSMSDGSMWTVYFTRQGPRSGDPKKRWFLYTIE